MTPPRHLWSGDWRRESAEAAHRLAERRGPVDAPTEPRDAEPPTPRPSALDRFRAALQDIELPRLRRRVTIPARLRSADARRIRGAVLLGAAMLLAAGAAFAAVSALRTSGSHASSASQTPSASSIRPGWLGVDTALFPLTNGAMIVDVTPGSPADNAGLQPGEIITEIDGRPVQGPGDLEAALAGMHAGQRVQIGYEQGPSTYTAQVTLRARPPGP
jgi:PDZ domain